MADTRGEGTAAAARAGATSGPAPAAGAESTGIRIERMLPLYEAKMIHQYDHRWATYDGGVDSRGKPAARDVTTAEKQDSSFVALPRYWLSAAAVAGKLPDWEDLGWLAGWRKIARSTDERTTIAGAFPRGGLGDSGNVLLAPQMPEFFPAILSAISFDFVARQKLGGTNFNFFQFQQLPLPMPAALTSPATFNQGTNLGVWLRPRILELTYTAWDMAPFAEDLGDIDADTGTVNPPFIWDDERRSWLRAEIDAAFFHLYGIARDDADYILDTFPIVRRHDEQNHGTYRTKHRILELYDAMAAATLGHPYTSPITPPPGHGTRHQPQ